MTVSLLKNSSIIAQFRNTGGKNLYNSIVENVYYDSEKILQFGIIDSCLIRNVSALTSVEGPLFKLGCTLTRSIISNLYAGTLMQGTYLIGNWIDNISCDRIIHNNQATYSNLFTNVHLLNTSYGVAFHNPRSPIINNTIEITSTPVRVNFNNSWDVGSAGTAQGKRTVANNIVLGNVIMTTAPSSVYSNNYCRTITTGSNSPAPISCIQGNIDPMFKNQLSGDFHLLPDSPFAHKGTSEFLSATGSTDLNGAKFNVHAPSMGCYEANFPTNPNMPSKYFPFGVGLV